MSPFRVGSTEDRRAQMSYQQAEGKKELVKLTQYDERDFPRQDTCLL